MKEDFLHFLWRTKRFDMANLRTTTNEALELINVGAHNSNAGPDFLNAKIRIGDTLWAGNVEMHLRASDWERHGHHLDKAYANVILHVVHEEDRAVQLPSGERLPCLELRGRVPAHLYNTYALLQSKEHWIPCAPFFGQTSGIVRQAWLDRLLVERLEAKTQQIDIALDLNEQNWEQVFYQFVARAFGMKVNAAPFELLAKSTPLLVLAKHKNSLLQMEALLFGQAGLLEGDFKDEYPRQLKKEYAFLKHKFRLQPINGASWKFLRLRPANFPTLRLAQFAALAHHSVHLFSKVLEAENLEKLLGLFEVGVSDYWRDHYVFDKPSKPSDKHFGKEAIRTLIINTVAPFLFLYGKKKANDTYKERALRLLEQLPAEKNATVEQWAQLGLAMPTAYQTQAAIQLKTAYCDLQRCLECAIGSAIMQTGKDQNIET
jgi:hypothetical protein